MKYDCIIGTHNFITFYYYMQHIQYFHVKKNTHTHISHKTSHHKPLYRSPSLSDTTFKGYNFYFGIHTTQQKNKIYLLTYRDLK